MKIEIFPGTVRKAKEKKVRKVFYVRYTAANGNITIRSAEGYNKLASAVNSVESLLAGLEAKFGLNVTVNDAAGKPVKVFVFVHVNETEQPGKRPYAYHYRKYGKLKPI